MLLHTLLLLLSNHHTQAWSGLDGSRFVTGFRLELRPNPAVRALLQGSSGPQYPTAPTGAYPPPFRAASGPPPPHVSGVQQARCYTAAAVGSCSVASAALRCCSCICQVAGLQCDTLQWFNILYP
jgi:hypothetical protein